jgi:6-phosphogluconolactonase
MLETRVGPREEISLSVASWLATSLRSVLAVNDRAVLGLPGGRSIALPLAALANELLDWSRIEIFFVDERHLSPGNPERNDQAVDELLTSSLVARGKLEESRIHRVPYLPGHPEAAATSYGQELQEYGGAVDVAMFGAGEDGHIASLFPGRSELLSAGTAFLSVRDAPKPPSDRVSMSPALIRTISSICLLFFGESKRDALRNFQDEEAPPASCPAKLARAAGNLLVAADLAAGSGAGD